MEKEKQTKYMKAFTPTRQPHGLLGHQYICFQSAFNLHASDDRSHHFFFVPRCVKNGHLHWWNLKGLLFCLLIKEKVSGRDALSPSSSLDNGPVRGFHLRGVHVWVVRAKRGTEVADG
jgi:hypothetical protein